MSERRMDSEWSCLDVDVIGRDQAYRFNNRKMTDAERFDIAVKGIGRQAAYVRSLTGKERGSPKDRG